MRAAHPSWFRPSRSLAAPASPLIVCSSGACGARWRSCAPSSAGRACVAIPLRGLARSRARHRQPRARGPSIATALEIEEQLVPRSCPLAHAVGEADQLLLALRCGADNDQQALRIVFQPGLNMNAVDPEIDVAFRG